MSHRKPRYGLTGQPLHARYREDVDKSRAGTAGRIAKSFKDFFKEENVRSDDYWKAVWRSFWKPFRRHALNPGVIWSSAAVAMAGLGLGYCVGINPDLLGNGPKAYIDPPAEMQKDFDELKAQLGLEAANIKLMVSRDAPSLDYSLFAEPFTFGSPRLRRGATVCIPRMFLEPRQERKRNALASIQIGRTTFDWDTVNGQAGRQLLVLPRDELRFIMGKGLLLANDHFEFKRCASLPVCGSLAFFLYCGLVSPGVEFMQIIPKSKFTLAVEVSLLLFGAYVLTNHFFDMFMTRQKTAEEKVASLGKELRAAGISFLERLAAFRVLIRMELGFYVARFIDPDGELRSWCDDLEGRAKLLRKGAQYDFSKGRDDSEDW